MHRELRKLLKTAQGESKFVVVVFLDVRGFSSFAKIAESSETAVFLRSVYTQILDSYFPEASFFKPTGDGLLIILDWDEDSVDEVVASALDSSIRLVEEFSTLCSHDKMITFPVPGDLGVGIARGAATRLIAGERILDYSGRPLNLAARLMDLARPRGVVFDGSLSHGIDLGALAARFSEESVYIKGLAEDQPTRVFTLDGVVKVPEFNRHPMSRLITKSQDIPSGALREITEYGSYVARLDHEPSDPNEIILYVHYPKVSSGGRMHRTLYSFLTFPATLERQTGQWLARMEFDQVVSELKELGVKQTWPITLRLEYPTKP